MADKQQRTTLSGPMGNDPNPDTQPKAFDAHGTIGKQFTSEGALGGSADKVGGPFDKEGMVGKQFTKDGSLGGTVQNMMGGEKTT